MKPLAIVYTPDRALAQVQANVKASLATLPQKVLLEGVVLAAGTNTVPHRLGRRLTKWTIVRKRSSCSNIHDLQDSNDSPHLTLVLVAATAVTVDIEVE